MVKLPDVVGLTLCERLSFDDPGRASLIGIFHALRFREFPPAKVSFTAYCALYDGVGEGTITLVITRLHTDQDILTYQKWVTFPGRLQLVNMELKIQCAFPAPGRYMCELRFEKNYLSHRYLEIHQS
jgi:hypothetical protein